MKKIPFFLMSLFVLCILNCFAQLNTKSLLLNDSLAGFDERSVLETAPDRGITLEELPFYLAVQKRIFIKQKYNIKDVIMPFDYSEEAKAAVAYCLNEDLEDAGLSNPVPSTLTITTINGINGWTANSAWLAANSQSSCFLSTCCSANPNEVQVISAGSGGYIDPVIGAGYPVYSVYGGSLNMAATSANGFNSYGDWFVKVNSTLVNGSVNRITKTFTVTATNAIFNFAYLTVVNKAHCCCDNPSSRIDLKDCSGNSIKTYSVSHPPVGSACSFPGGCSIGNTDTIIDEILNDTTILSYDTLYPSPTFNQTYYTKWIKRSYDFTPWIGTCVRIEVSGIDCPYPGHFGYVYFDAQCGSAIGTGINSFANTYYKIYPNPSMGNFNIEISREIINGKMELRNVLGQVVFKQPVNKGINTINAVNIAKGVYAYSVYDGQKMIVTGKLLIE